MAAQRKFGQLFHALLTPPDTGGYAVYKLPEERLAHVTAGITSHEKVDIPQINIAITDDTYVSGMPDAKFIREFSKPLHPGDPLILNGVQLGPGQSIVAWTNSGATFAVSLFIEGIEEDA